MSETRSVLLSATSTTTFWGSIIRFCCSSHNNISIRWTNNRDTSSLVVYQYIVALRPAGVSACRCCRSHKNKIPPTIPLWWKIACYERDWQLRVWQMRASCMQALQMWEEVGSYSNLHDRFSYDRHWVNQHHPPPTRQYSRNMWNAGPCCLSVKWVRACVRAMDFPLPAII